MQEAPDLLSGSIAAMAPAAGGALARVGEQFVQAWQQALADAVDGLELLTVALDLAAQLYDTTQQLDSDRHGITLIGGIR